MQTLTQMSCHFTDFTSALNPNVSQVNQVNIWLNDKRGDFGHGAIAFMYIVSGVFGILMCCFTVIAYVVAKMYANLDLTTYLLK